jgi:hypothetical protein
MELKYGLGIRDLIKLKLQRGFKKNIHTEVLTKQGHYYYYYYYY